MTKKTLIIFGAVVALWLLLFQFGVGEQLTLANFKIQRAEWVECYNLHPAPVILLFGILYMVLTAISFPGASLLSLLAGALFGVIGGSMIVLVSATAGAVAAFLLVRTTLGNFFRTKFARRLGAIEEGFRRDGARYLFFLRLNPIVPFFLINAGMGFTPISTKTYTWVSLVGMIPGTVLYVNAGTQLGQIQSPSDLLSGEVIVSCLALGLLPFAFKFLLPKYWANKKH